MRDVKEGWVVDIWPTSSRGWSHCQQPAVQSCGIQNGKNFVEELKEAGNFQP